MRVRVRVCVCASHSDDCFGLIVGVTSYYDQCLLACISRVGLFARFPHTMGVAVGVGVGVRVGVHVYVLWRFLWEDWHGKEGIRHGSNGAVLRWRESLVVWFFIYSFI